jgi:hypothetical protein
MTSIGEHWFWGFLTIAALAWYILITSYVAVRGALDIKTMLRSLSEKAAEE